MLNNETAVWDYIKKRLKEAAVTKQREIVIPANEMVNATTGPRLHIKENLAAWVKEAGGTLVHAYEDLGDYDLHIVISWDDLGGRAKKEE